MVNDPTVLSAVDALIADLPMDLAALTQAAIARVLASKLDDARVSSSGAVSVAVPGLAKELRAVLADLVMDNSEMESFVDGLFGREAEA